MSEKEHLPFNRMLLILLFGRNAMCVHVLSVYSSLQSCVGREGSALAPLADAAQPSCRKSEGKKKREAVVGSRMRIETVSPAALGTAGFRYLYSVCFFKLFGPTGL